MSMLAENRRKSKWVINPTKKPIWSTDSNGIKFGKQLMEKMGWSAGKGLGLNEQGIQEPLKVSFKNDTKGMGFKGNDDDWIEHQDEFNMLLNQLRSNDGSSAVNDSAESNEVKSLEEKSKQSKARVHYQKFTRGKDLSKYSENDLACILGTGKTKKKDKPKTEEVVESETKNNGNFETSFGVTTINSGSINDYFKKKWMVKPSGLATEADEEDREENFRPSFSCGNSGFSLNDYVSVKPDEQKASEMHKSTSEIEPLPVAEEQTPELDETGNTERVGKKKRKKQGVEINSEQEEPGSKKRKKNGIDNSGLESLSKQSESLSLHSANCCNSEEEKKTDKNHDKSEMFADEVALKREKKERKKAKRKLEDISPEEPEQIRDTSNGRIALEEESTKRKKKRKKEKTDENEVIESGCNNDIQLEPSAEDVNASSLKIESVKKKKKKKEKLNKSERIDSNIEDIDSTEQMKNQEVGITEKCTDAYHSDNSMDVESGKKKKKKKDKKEKLKECDDNNLEVHCRGNKNSRSFEDIAEGEVGEKSERENAPEWESGKKKKKKSKKEKLDENNEIINGSTQIEESSLEDTTTEKIISSCEKETTLENESVKRKKKKKDKKEKHKQIECKGKESCLKEEKTEECILDEELIEKKKKKKHKKEKREDSEGAENKEDQGDEKFGEGLDLSVNNNEVNGVLNTKTEGQDRLQKLRGSLFPDKAADKYFPEQSRNERVLRLIRWANIEEFKGSNLCDVEGYGRRITHQKQSR